MKNLIPLLLIFTVGVLSSCKEGENLEMKSQTVSVQQEDDKLASWTRKSDYPGGNNNLETSYGFTINERIFVGVTSGNIEKEPLLFEFVPGENKWIKKNAIGLHRNHVISFSIGNYAYMGLGYAFLDFRQNMFRYDPGTDSWKTVARFPVDPGIRQPATFSTGDKGYVLLANRELYEYNPITNKWIKKASLPAASGAEFEQAVSFSIGSKGYIGTGRSFGNEFTARFWEYNPATNAWARKADFAGGERWLAAGFSVGNKGYVGTGSGRNTIATQNCDFWEYDPSKNKWKKLPPFPGGSRSWALGVSSGTKGYLGLGLALVSGGQTISRTDFWEFNPNL